MIILNEREYAENCLKNGIIDTKPYITLSILAKYYYHACGYRKKKIKTLLLEYLSKYYPRYELNALSWQTSIEKSASNAGNYQLFEIPGIRITESEMSTIINLHNKALERLIFTMLCLAKLNDCKNPNNNGWVNTSTSDLFKYARISATQYEQDVKLNKLYQKGLLEFPKQADNLNCRVTFLDNESAEELFISDFRELGYEYQKYRGGNFIRCAGCKILTPGNKNGTKKYCSSCTAHTPKESKSVICMDCGEEFEVGAMNNRGKRCPACKHEKQLEYQRKAMAKKRSVK